MTKNEGLAPTPFFSLPRLTKRDGGNTHTPPKVESCLAACLCFYFLFFQVSLSPFRCLAPRISFRQALGPWPPQYTDRPDTPVVDKGVTHTSGWSHTCADSPSTFNPNSQIRRPHSPPLYAAARWRCRRVACGERGHSCRPASGCDATRFVPRGSTESANKRGEAGSPKKKKKLSRPRPRVYPKLSLVVEPLFSFFFPT